MYIDFGYFAYCDRIIWNDPINGLAKSYYAQSQNPEGKAAWSKLC